MAIAGKSAQVAQYVATFIHHHGRHICTAVTRVKEVDSFVMKLPGFHISIIATGLLTELFDTAVEAVGRTCRQVCLGTAMERQSTDN